MSPQLHGWDIHIVCFGTGGARVTEVRLYPGEAPRRGGKELHHLIDPRTGAPAETDLLRVTAVGDDAVAAEVLAKSLFLAGEREAAESTVPAVLVTADGRTRFSRGLQQ